MDEIDQLPRQSKGKRFWLIGSIVLVWLAVVVIVIFQQKIQRPDLFSSPVESRDVEGYKEESWLDLLEEADRSIDEDFPADQEMAVPVILPGNKNDFVLHWKGEAIVQEGPIEDYWAEGMQDGQSLELAAIAYWIPSAEDPIDAVLDGSWKAELKVRDAKTLEEISPAKLAEMGLPDEFRFMEPTKGRYRTPKVRLFFRSENMKHLRILSAEGGDRRTGAVVTYDLESIGGNAAPFDSEGEWAKYDMAFLSWHDVPLKFHVRLLTGDPVYAELSQKTGEQVAFGDLLRIQWLTVVDGEPSDESGLDNFLPAKGVAKEEVKGLRVMNTTYSYEEDSPNAVWVKVKKADDYPKPVPLVRFSSADYLQHLGMIRSDGSLEWDIRREVYSNQFQAATFPDPDSPDQPIRLVFLPKRTELTFEVSAVPDAPNPGDIEDLFDVKIPRLTLSEDFEQAEDELVGILSVAAQIGWEHSNLWDENPPDDFPKDRTFLNKTPQELVNWYLDVTPGARVKYRQGQKVILVNPEEEGFWTRVKTWFSETLESFGIY